MYQRAPLRQAEIIQRLGTKYKLRINLQGRPHKEPNDEEKIWLIEFHDRSDRSLIQRTIYIFESLMMKANINKNNIFCGLYVKYCLSPMVTMNLMNRWNENSTNN